LDTREELLSPILDAAANIKKRENQLLTNNTQELQSALRLTVEFGNIYC